VSASALAEQDVALVDLLDRLLAGGVVIAGEITLAVANIDLVHVSLRALVSSVATAYDEGLLDGLGESLDKDALRSDSLGSTALDSSALDSSALDSSALDKDAL
jgi:hypothetical protein